MWELGSVLGVWAHPDDETYASGGSMLRAVRAGHRVACITATRGELGSPDPERWPPGEPLARVRTRELEAALGVLGVSEHRWLDYADGACAEVPLAEGVAHVEEWVARVRPDTVLTFPPDGMTGHPDHIAVSRWVDEAVAGLAEPRPRVLWCTWRTSWAERWMPALDELGAFVASRPTPTPDDDLRALVELDEEELDVKVRSLLEQPSQVQPLVDHVGLDGFRRMVGEEPFR